LVGDRVDSDDDGYDGCWTDCDDRNPEVHPGAPEACDLRDNNCNGLIDEPGHCPKCLDDVGPGEVAYRFCFERVVWAEARQRCADDGLDLVSIHGPEAWEFVTFGLLVRGIEAEQVWIGLYDTGTEGVFVWTDGSALDYRHWTDDSPKPAPWGDESDCVASSPWGWEDLPCDRELPYVCREAP
jgi:hypothetical protein